MSFHFKSSFYGRMKTAILDLYWMLTDSTYSIKQTFIPLDKKYFEKEYLQTMDYVQDTVRFADNYYSLQDRIQIVQQEAEAWNELMEKRKNVSSSLGGKVKSVYDHATYRLQKQHLIELKNEFADYGYFSAEYGECLLKDSCEL